MKKVWDFVKEELTWSQQAQTEAANRHRKDVEYEVGDIDMAWLSTKNIKTDRPSKKLDHKMISPYRVTKLMGSPCQLDLPVAMKIHVFHPSLLRKAATDPLTGQYNVPPPLVIVAGEEEEEVEEILNAKRTRGFEREGPISSEMGR